MDGAIEFIKYAYPPNKLRYCGPSDSGAIFDYFTHQKIDRGLLELLTRFNGAYPNLAYIARANQIKNPFDIKVVRAYWIGNELLNNVSISDYYNYLREKFKGQWDKKMLDLLFGLSRPFGAKPHHSFHVMSLFAKKKVNKKILEHINNCLILPGKIAKIKPNSVTVEYRPIVTKNNSLILSKIQEKKLEYFNQEKLIKGNVVSFHWNWACDKINHSQLKNLNFWNQYHLNLVNQII